MIHKLRVLAIAAFCIAVSATEETQIYPNNSTLIQKAVYDLLWHVDQPDKVHPEIYKLGTAWDIEANIGLYENQFVVREFLQRYNYGMLPRGEIFSIYYPEHQKEAVALFEVFDTAGSIQTFINTASWARVHMNEEVFVYAFTIAVMHRLDTAFLRLPHPYEIQPNFYFNMDVIHQAYDYKMGLNYHDGKSEPKTFIARANYTHFYSTDTRDPETRLNYFREDVDLNAFYYYFNQGSPFWMPSEKYNLPAAIRGEFYYFIHKLILNRYYMERLSHGLGEVELFDWEKPIMTGFTPALGYRNGFQFPQRTQWTPVPVHKFGFVASAQAFEARITAAIDYGYYLTKGGKSEGIYTQKGFNMIGNIIQGNADSPNRDFYGSFDHVARAIIGFSPRPHSKYQILPSALEHFSTSLRDPAFYRIYNRIIHYLDTFKGHMNAYRRDELVSEGVEIESVAIDKLVTFYDRTDTLISNTVRVHDHQDAESILIKARQSRLNHAPFTYHMTVKSDKETLANVRIFLGPKFNVHGKEVDISENYKHFYQLDYFTIDLKTGTNKIERRSSEANFTIPDKESSDVFYKKIQVALENHSELPAAGERRYGFPDRLILPKGRLEGLPIQFFVYVNAIDDTTSQPINSRFTGEWLYDFKPFGFPLDRPIFGHNFTASNMLFKDAHIFHNEEGDSKFKV